MRPNALQDVWKYIDIGAEDDCWVWNGPLTRPQRGSGYGYFRSAGESYVAHRVVYFLTFGAIQLHAPRDKTLREFVLHRCDNRVCCNPKHLFLGSYDDNNKDAKAKHRSRAPRGDQHKKAKLKQWQADEIRAQLAAGKTRKEMRVAYGVSERIVDRIARNEGYRA